MKTINKSRMHFYQSNDMYLKTRTRNYTQNMNAIKARVRKMSYTNDLFCFLAWFLSCYFIVYFCLFPSFFFFFFFFFFASDCFCFFGLCVVFLCVVFFTIPLFFGVIYFKRLESVSCSSMIVDGVIDG